MTKPVPLDRVGTIGLGFHTSRLAWPKLEWVFQVGGQGEKEQGKEARIKYGSLNRANQTTAQKPSGSVGSGLSVARGLPSYS